MTEENKGIISKNEIEQAIKVLKELSSDYPEQIVNSINNVESNMKGFEGLKYADASLIITVIMSILPSSEIRFITEMANDIINGRFLATLSNN